MTDEELLQITNSIEEKLGDSSALIADDLGLLITGNSKAQQMLADRQSEIDSLKSTNEKLVIANGNLLKQVPVEHKVVDEPKARQSSDVDEKIKLSDAFDATGRFIR